MEVNWTEIIVLVGTALICALAYTRWIYKYWERRNVPYLKPSLPMGNFEAPWAIKKGIHSTMIDVYNQFKTKGYKYGGIFSSLRPVFVPVDLDLLKSIMIKDFQHFTDRGLYYHEKADPLSAHMFSIGGERWRNLRVKLSPTFTSGKMKSMFQTILDCGGDLENEINKLWMNKQPVNIKEIGALFTTNVISSCAFGLDCNCFENPNNEFRTHARKLFKGDLGRVLRNYITLSFPKLCEKLGVKVFPSDMTQFYMDVTKNIINHRESNEVSRNDFVQLLLNIKNNTTEKEKSLTLEEIAAQSFLFFLAGFETSSSTMTFTFYEMAKNQEVQDKVREEIHRVLQKHNGKLTYEAIMEMTYMSQVFDETLRKYPIVATLERVVTMDYRVPGSDVVLKKGTKVLIPLQGIQNDPEYFPEPAKFDPDRFLPENKINRHVCAYMPFGEGPRICIGMRFGILQAKIGIAIMIKDYKFALNQKELDMVLYNKSPLLAPIGDVLLDIVKVS